MWRLTSSILLLVLAASGSGCALRPDSAPWREDQKTIVAQPPDAMGYLTVETEEVGTPEEGEPQHQRFYVYDQSGRYLNWFPNQHFLPVGLTPGRYVIVSRHSGRNKRVQVEIRDGCSALIRLNDFKDAPAID